jgi:hypothetical protein
LAPSSRSGRGPPAHRRDGRPRRSVVWVGPARRRRRGSWSSARRVTGRWPAPRPPFSARGRAMGLHMRGVDHEGSGRPTRLRQVLEQALPDALGRPPHKAIVERLVRAISSRSVLPSAARLQDMDDPGNHPGDHPPAPRPACPQVEAAEAARTADPSTRSRLSSTLSSQSLNHNPLQLGIQFMGPEPRLGTHTNYWHNLSSGFRFRFS